MEVDAAPRRPHLVGGARLRSPGVSPCLRRHGFNTSLAYPVAATLTLSETQAIRRIEFPDSQETEPRSTLTKVHIVR